MGGSGGSSSRGSWNPATLAQEIRTAEREGVSTAFLPNLAVLLADYLGRFNGRDAELVNSRMNDVKQHLGNEVEGSLDLSFGGSIAKRTYVDGLSDVDCLLTVSGTELEHAGPEAARDKLAQVLSTQLQGEAVISKGNLAVTVTYPDGMEIQFLPAIKVGEKLKISSAGGTRWSEIDPQGFQQTLTKHNQECGSKLVPTIKLAKAVISQFPDEQKLSGYHIESLAVDAFRGYQGTKAVNEMLPYFFEKAKERVLRPMTDTTGQSVHVDSDLGAANSVARLNASHLLGRIAKRMRNATAAQSSEQWKNIFGDAGDTE